MGVSAGLFAPGWCWEHFGSRHDREAAEGAMWKGQEIGEDVKCDCKAGFWDGDVHRTKEYRDWGIAKSTRKYVVGTKRGFYTGFERAFGVHGRELDEWFGGKRMHAQLGVQGIMPVDVEEEGEIRWSVDDEKPGKLNIIAGELTRETDNTQHLKLYNLGICLEGDTRLMVRYQRVRSMSTSISFLIKFQNSSGEFEQAIPLPVEKGNDVFVQRLNHVPGRNTTITELRVTVTGVTLEKQEVLQLTSLSIGCPSSFPLDAGAIHITNIEITVQGTGRCKHGRLTWQLDNLPEKQSKSWSERTGPIAFFEIGVDNVIIGRACGLEFVLPEHLVERWRSVKGVEVEVGGILFGGERMAKFRALLKVEAR